MSRLDASLAAFDAELDNLKSKIHQLEWQNRQALRVLGDIFKSECLVSCDIKKDQEKYDHYDRPAFAEAQDLLLKNQMIKENQCLQPSLVISS